MSGIPQDGQIVSLGDVLGTSLGPIFAGWAIIHNMFKIQDSETIMC